MIVFVDVTFSFLRESSPHFRKQRVVQSLSFDIMNITDHFLLRLHSVMNYRHETSASIRKCTVINADDESGKAINLC